jgi:hypothetical protein
MKKITLLLCLTLSFVLSAQEVVFSDDFNAETIDATTFTNWVSTDEDGDGNFWEVVDMAAYAAASAPNHPMQSLVADSDSWEGSAFSPDNYLTTTNPIDLSTISGAMLNYRVGTYQTGGTFANDKYSVYLTASNVIADILATTPITTRLVVDDALSDSGDGANSAADIVIDVSAFDGQSVYLTFRHFDTVDENSVLIDDVSVEGTLLSNDEFSLNSIKHYFNHDSKVLTLESQVALKDVVLYNVLGQETYRSAITSTFSEQNLSGLQSGIYIAKINAANNKSKTIKLVIK